jgi:hypothetical protein
LAWRRIRTTALASNGRKLRICRERHSSNRLSKSVCRVVNRVIEMNDESYEKQNHNHLQAIPNYCRRGTDLGADPLQAMSRPRLTLPGKDLSFCELQSACGRYRASTSQAHVQLMDGVGSASLLRQASKCVFRLSVASLEFRKPLVNARGLGVL